MSPIASTRLGESSLTVSRIALGSWPTFERLPRDAAEQLLAHALAQGVSFLDDARYNDETGRAPLPTGWSEVLFGELFRAAGVDRSSVVVSNKLWWEFWPREDALTELHGSLQRMRFDRLDLLYSSTPPENLPVPVVIEQIAEVLASGLIDAWGVVNWSAQQLAEGVRAAQRLEIAMPCAVQLPYNLAQLDWVEDPAMLAAIAAGNSGLVGSAVLAGGALSGKYASGGTGRLTPEVGDTRRQRALSIGAALPALAAELDTSPATLATAFTLTNPLTASTLIGATQPSQVDAAIEAIAVADRLTAPDLERLRALAAS